MWYNRARFVDTRVGVVVIRVCWYNNIIIRLNVQINLFTDVKLILQWIQVYRYVLHTSVPKHTDTYKRSFFSTQCKRAYHHRDRRGFSLETRGHKKEKKIIIIIIIIVKHNKMCPPVRAQNNNNNSTFYFFSRQFTLCASVLLYVLLQ